MIFNFLKLRQKITHNTPKKFKDYLISYMFLNKRFPNYKLICEKLKNKKVIEIGGPSGHFYCQIPLYQKIKSLDIVNYSTQTVWEGSITKKKTNYFSNKYANQIIAEATNLKEIKNNFYDAVISSNCLEHVANPLKALFEKNRIIDSKGYFLLILPNKKMTFDHRRPFTTFKHIISDYKNNIGEDDLTHYDEIISLHDYEMDGLKNKEELISRAKNNYINRCFHHHVFNYELIYKMLEYTNFKIISFVELDHDFIILSQKN